MAHAINHRPLIMKAQVRSRVTPSEICILSQTREETNADSETERMAVCCQNLPLVALSSRCAPSVLVGELFKKFGLFFKSNVHPNLHRRISSHYFLLKLNEHFFQISQAHYVPSPFRLHDKVNLLPK
jgi:hypothetical protein